MICDLLSVCKSVKYLMSYFEMLGELLVRDSYHTGSSHHCFMLLATCKTFRARLATLVFLSVLSFIAVYFLLLVYKIEGSTVFK